MNVRKILRDELQKKWILSNYVKLDNDSLEVLTLHFTIDAIQIKIDEILRLDSSESTRRYHRSNLRVLTRNFADILIESLKNEGISRVRIHRSHRISELIRGSQEKMKSVTNCDIYPCMDDVK